MQVDSHFRRSMAHRVSACALALPLLIAIAPAPAHAQSMQSINDKLSQLQNSLNSIAAGITARLLTIGDKLDAIIGKLDAPAVPTFKATEPVSVNTGETARCAIVNSGTTSAEGTVKLYNGGVFVGSSGGTAIAPGDGGAISQIAPGSSRYWCRLELGAGGHQLRAGMTIIDAAGTRLLHLAAH
jgi:hypothetical protein